MNNFELMIYLTFIGYMTILYFAFHWLRKNKSIPVYKMMSYWVTSVVTYIGIYGIGLFIFLNILFGITDYTDSEIKYGVEIIAGEDDGLMYTDWVKIYDNNTFHILSHQIESNGYYSKIDDTIKLEHNQDYNEKKLPDILVVRNKSITGYHIKNNKIDTSYYYYFSLYKNTTSP